MRREVGSHEDVTDFFLYMHREKEDDRFGWARWATARLVRPNLIG
jgi:hypothetical protein